MINQFINLMLLSMVLFMHTKLCAQKGVPPKSVTSASVNTKFPGHEDFNERLVNRLTVPAGFKVIVAATGLGKPRMMAMSPAGNLYITRRDAGDVLMLTDTDNDGKFDERKTIISQFDAVHGIALRDDWIYVCANRELRRYRMNSDGTAGAIETLITDLPDGSQHDNRTLGFRADSKLFITVGSSCNDCKETNDEYATILIANADGSDRKVFAKGLRNTLGFDWHPQSKELWGMDHGTDWRGDEIPPEELNNIMEAGDYGWPLVYGKQVVDETREDPVGTTKAAYAKTTQPAVLTFPAHSAPIGFQFLTKATSFPQEYKDDALVTWHGSWNRKNPEGFKVQRIIFENGKPVRAVDFLSGFLAKDGTSRFGRPTGLVISSKGVYISDDANGVIYFVTTQGK